MTGVFLVDDHEVVRQGIAHIINAEPDLCVVGESATVRGTLSQITAVQPDVVVLDVHLPDGNGIDLCRSIRSADPGIGCLIFTAYDDDAAGVAAVLAGAATYVLKNIRGRHLVQSIRRVAKGETFISQDLAERVRASPTFNPQAQTALTLREEQVLTLITEGLTNKQIGQHLGLAEKTVKNYVSGLLAKMGMERRTQVAAYGARKPNPRQYR